MPSTLTIGSGPDCDVSLAVPSVSGRHCRLTREGQAVLVEDLGSRNGTYVNGARLEPSERIAITPADTVHLGSHRLDLLPLLPRLVADVVADQPRILEFLGEQLVIGRVPGNDLVVDLPTVSSRHAVLMRSGATIVIEDLGSSNGTYVDGIRIVGPTVLGPDSTLSLGSAPFRLSETSWQPVEVAEFEIREPATEMPSRWPSIPVVAAIFLAGTPVAALAPLVVSTGPARLFAMAVAAVTLGSIDAVAAAILRGPAGVGRNANKWRTGVAVAALALVQCQFLWLAARWVGGVSGDMLPTIAILSLAALTGAAGTAVAFRIILGPVALRFAVAAVLVIASGLLGGFAPAASDLPAAIRPALSVSPVRWAFEGLMLARPEGEHQALAERYFPAATDRMGLAADCAALAFLAVGLAGVAAIRRPDDSAVYPAFLTA